MVCVKVVTSKVPSQTSYCTLYNEVMFSYVPSSLNPTHEKNEQMYVFYVTEKGSDLFLERKLNQLENLSSNIMMFSS